MQSQWVRRKGRLVGCVVAVAKCLTEKLEEGRPQSGSQMKGIQSRLWEHKATAHTAPTVGEQKEMNTSAHPTSSPHLLKLTPGP